MIIWIILSQFINIVLLKPALAGHGQCCTITLLHMSRINKTKSAIFVSLRCALLREDLHSYCYWGIGSIPDRGPEIFKSPWHFIVWIVFSSHLVFVAGLKFDCIAYKTFLVTSLTWMDTQHLILTLGRSTWYGWSMISKNPCLIPAGVAWALSDREIFQVPFKIRKYLTGLTGWSVRTFRPWEIPDYKNTKQGFNKR